MKSMKLLLATLLIASIAFGYSPVAEAKVMWGKTELKEGQIGKVTILFDLASFDVDGNRVRLLKKGEEFRVYSFRRDIYGGEYGIGNGMFVHMHGALKYETPSKSKLALLKEQNDNLTNGMWGKIALKDGYNAKVVITKETYLTTAKGEKTRLLNVGEEYRIHGLSNEPYLIDLGANHYVYKDSVKIMEKWMYGKTEWKIGQKGRLTILEPATLVSFDPTTGNPVKVRDLKTDEQYRVYGQLEGTPNYYNVGGGYYIASNSLVKYETPSKEFLNSVENRLVK